MAGLQDYIMLLRPVNWYKNLVIFIPSIFGMQLFEGGIIAKTLLGFAVLCAVSSAGYAINDIIDSKSDRLHPEKRKRPIASGKISKGSALSVSFFSLAVASMILVFLSPAFSAFAASLFALMLAYSLFFRGIAFIDISFISLNFVLRAVSGAFVISEKWNPYIWVSPWLPALTFLLAFFIAASKRRADLVFLREKSLMHRKSLGSYSNKIIRILVFSSASLLFMVYLAYAFFGLRDVLLSVPFAALAIIRYLVLAEKGSPVPRQPSRAFFDAWIFLFGVLWIASVVASIYIF